jgi:hypothetical protein
MGDPRSVQEEKGDDAQHCQGRYHCTPVHMRMVHRAASSRSLSHTIVVPQSWCVQAAARSLAATVAMALHARQPGRGHALIDHPHDGGTEAAQ